MSTHELPIGQPSLLGSASGSSGILSRIGGVLETVGERLNPLLVKEVRQALKSRQFLATFSLVLLAAWIWTIFGIAQLGPNVEYRPDGVEMFFGYYLILTLPLMLIVPYSAFRSLVAEREDNTYELVAITALRPRQIVGGKLWCAIAQMLVYLSAVAPCLAFTYLLHGIDIFTICWILFWTFAASLAFSMISILLATVSKEKHWQVVNSVIIIVALFVIWLYASFEICRSTLRSSHLRFQDPNLWSGALTFLAFYASTFALVYLAAAAQLTFTADNRSTPLRYTMLVQHMCIAGAFGYLIATEISLRPGTWEVAGAAGMGFYGVATVFWWFMGSFMVGENPELSPRVKRSLPTSNMGRLFRTLFNPGPGTGYLLTVSSIAAAGLMAGVGVAHTISSGPRAGGFPATNQMVTVMLLMLCYPTIYLGLVSLLLRVLRRFTIVTIGSSFAYNLLAVIAGWGISWCLDPYNVNQSSYNMLHISDPFWTCLSVVDPRKFNPDSDLLLAILIPAALVVLALNLLYIIPEIRHVRIAAPARVEEEERTLAAATEPAHQPANPWD
jgi:hypothetical protein